MAVNGNNPDPIQRSPLVDRHAISSVSATLQMVGFLSALIFLISNTLEVVRFNHLYESRHFLLIGLQLTFSVWAMVELFLLTPRQTSIPLKPLKIATCLQGLIGGSRLFMGDVLQTHAKTAHTLLTHLDLGLATVYVPLYMLSFMAVSRFLIEAFSHEERQRTAQLAIANAAKSQFLASMSHEIRTPMNGVLGLAQLLEQEPLTDDQMNLVKLINNSGKTLLGIINDILDFSKIEAGQLAIEQHPFHLKDTLESVTSLLGVTAHKKGLVLRHEQPSSLTGRLLGDALRIEQILLNLGSNAVKFTEQGEVVVRVMPLAMTDQTVRLRFEVQDTGIGLSPEAIEKLFQPFTQADGSITRRFGGTGLGLSISKRLVELMGGTIGVDSTLGQGSTFWFELPFDRVAEAAVTEATAAQPAGPALQGLRLLVVDDSAINLLVAERALKQLGADVTTAKNGQQALDCLTAHPEGFDLVLMDIQMPVMDGLAATRAIREELQLKHLPVIALTAGVLPEERQSALEAGVNDFLPKPFELDMMARVISKACQVEAR